MTDMNYHYGAPAIGLLIFFIFLVGCTSTAPPPERTLGTIEPADLALQLSDLPAGFTIQEKWERARSEVRQSAVDKGWKKGYHVMFRRLNESTLQVEYLTQDIDVYPIETVNQALAQGNAEMLQRGEDAYQVDQLPNPKIGDSSQAYSVKLMKKSKNINARGLFIQFVKKDVYEQIVMLSVLEDYESLNEIAKIASAEIK